MHIKASVFFQVSVAISDFKSSLSSSNLQPLTISRVLLISSFTNTVTDTMSTSLWSLWTNQYKPTFGHFLPLFDGLFLWSIYCTYLWMVKKPGRNTLFYKNKPHVGVRLGVINDICYVFSMSVVVVRCEHSVRMGWPVI